MYFLTTLNPNKSPKKIQNPLNAHHSIIYVQQQPWIWFACTDELVITLTAKAIRVTILFLLSLFLPFSLFLSYISLSPSFSTYLPIFFSPYLLLSLSSSLPISFSPYLPISFSPYLPISYSPSLFLSLSIERSLACSQSTVCAICYNVLTFFIRSQTFVVRFCLSWCHMKSDHQGNFELKFQQHPLQITWSAANPS
jgi:hypothetical protein